MYEAFYGLSEKPFNLTPDPKYLFLSEKHKEAFAHLLYGIKSGSGFVMVTGEIGTGKTTICRNLVRQLDSDTELAFIFNPSLKPVELIRKILTEFGLTPVGDNVLDLVEELNVYLLEAKTRGRNCVLLIDEAQNLSPQVLEQIRLLSNLETETEKLLQIVLVGQPELGEMLALHELRQLNQRITARYHLKELSEKETLQYVAYRLHTAGGRRSVRFNRSAIRQIYKHSGGTPRMINAICDRALLIGYTREAHIITAAIVKKAAVEIRGEKIRTGKKKRAGLSRWRWLPSPALLLALVLAYFLVQQFGPVLGEIVDGVRVFRDVATLGVPVARPGDPVTPAADAKTRDNTSPEKTVDPPETPEVSVTRKAQEPEKAPGETIPLGEALLATDPETACRSASRTLLRIWDVTLPEDRALPASDRELVTLAGELGLKHERIRPALSQLVALDLPALIRLRPGKTGSASRDYWVALVGADDDRLWLTAEGDKVVEAPRGEILDAYADEAIVLWRDKDPKAPDMMLGRKGPYVAALKANLRLLHRLEEGARDDRYDSHTAGAVSKLQAETGLIVDGIAGRQVRMVLNSWLPGTGSPTLKRAVPGEDRPEALETIARANPPSSPVPPKPKAPETGPTPTPSEKVKTGPTPTPSEKVKTAKAPATESEKASGFPVADDTNLLSIEDLDVPFFPTGLGPLSPLDLKERTAPAPGIPPLTDGQTGNDGGADGTPTPEEN